MRTLADLIEFNQAVAADEMPYFGQGSFELAQTDSPLTEQAYLAALANSQRLGGTEGIDATLARHNLDAIIAPTGQSAWPID